MKKHIMAFTMMMVALSIFSAKGAANYPWLTFTLNDNSEVSVPAENLQLTYADGNLQLSSATVDQTFPISSLKSMRFDSEQSATERVEANMPVEVFNTNGVKVGIFCSIEEAVNCLPHGVYVIRNRNTSKKVMF